MQRRTRRKDEWNGKKIQKASCTGTFPKGYAGSLRALDSLLTDWYAIPIEFSLHWRIIVRDCSRFRINSIMVLKNDITKMSDPPVPNRRIKQRYKRDEYICLRLTIPQKIPQKDEQRNLSLNVIVFSKMWKFIRIYE